MKKEHTPFSTGRSLPELGSTWGEYGKSGSGNPAMNRMGVLIRGTPCTIALAGIRTPAKTVLFARLGENKGDPKRAQQQKKS